MSTPVMPSYINKIGIAGIIQVRKMNQTIAREWLKKNHPDLTEEEFGDVLALLPANGRHKTASVAYDPHQKLFVTMAWLCGASMPQLARMLGVTRQTILDKINRTMGKDERNAMRLGNQLEDWQLEGLKDNYYTLINSNSHVFDNLNAYDVAFALKDLPVKTQPDVPADTYATLDSPEHS